MIWAWVIFIGFVFLMLALDLGVFHRKSHVVGFKESLTWSGVWISLGLAFSVLVYYAYELHWFGLGNSVDAVDKLVNTGKLAATKYLTAYVVEKSLSVDNIFVIAMVFSSLAVPPRYQHRVLFWGIIGALVMRGARRRSIPRTIRWCDGSGSSFRSPKTSTASISWSALAATGRARRRNRESRRSRIRWWRLRRRENGC
jgi:hypothetical protein